MPSPESVAGRKPLVAVIGGSENVLGAIESCKNRLAFVLLNAIPEGPNFWSVHQISCVVICGLDWFTQFCETKPADELAVVVVVNNLNEFSAGLRSGVSSLLIEPFSGDLLLSHVERQLQLVTERKRSEQILGAQKEILEIIAGGATFEETVGALALLIESIEPDVRCAISAINSDGATFSKVYAPSLPRPCKVRLLQTPVGPPMLHQDRQSANNHDANFHADLAADGQWNDNAWVKALIADGLHSCLFIPIFNSKRQPVAVFSLFGKKPADVLAADSQLVQTATYLATIAFQKREREEELAAERERLRLAVIAGQLGIWNWDLSTNELEWSEQCKILFGCAPDAKVTFEDFLAMLHPEDRDRAIKAIEDSVRDGVPYDIEYRVRRPDGETRWIAVTGRTFKDDFDRAIRMSGVARDVTERRQVDDALQENQYQLRTALNAAELARREAESATKAKDQFLAVLSHELRTPLTPILMAASWLRNSQEISEQARKAFDMIFRNVEIEARLIDDLLDLTRIERNRLGLQIRVVDLHTVLKAAIEVCETGILQKKQRLNLELAAARSSVQCDVARIQQVLWNLLKNATKFTPEGGVISVTSRNEYNDIVVDVSDTGIGIDARVIPKIFVPFEQGGKDISKQFGGLGLGLAISKTIIDAHGGAIAVSSEGKDLGAVFSIRLPLTDEPGLTGNPC